jgi:hypothetical protein
MATNEEKFEELRDILFWQQLNRQLIELRDRGVRISEQNQKGFQQFCFENKLFYKLTEDPIIDEFQLAIVTDFSDKQLVTFKNNCWINCLNVLLDKTVILDVELALSNTFDEIRKYEKKYLIKQVDSDQQIEGDDDDELYEVIEQYNALIEEQHRNIPEILNKLYEIKGSVISAIISDDKSKDSLTSDGSIIALDFKQSPDKNEILEMYNGEFCDRALKTIGHLTAATVAFKDMELEGFFNNAESRKGVKQSILDFIAHERDVQRRQSVHVKEFNAAVKEWQDDRGRYYIKVCKATSFAFLQRPFPEI